MSLPHWLSIALLAMAAVCAAATSTPSPPTAPSISFFWSTDNDTDLNIPECSQFRVTTGDNPGGPVAPVAPFYFLAAPVDGLPQVQLVKGALDSSFLWEANLPPGTTLTLAMSDSANSSGGSVGPYTMVKGTTNCTLAATTSAFSFTADPPSNACEAINLKISGGQAPFTVSVLSPGIGRYANLTDVTSRTVALGNTLAAGTVSYLFITDSLGASTLVSDAMVSGLGQSTCVEPTSTSSTPLGAIIGGSVGGVLLALVLLLIGYYFLRKKKNRAAEEAHRQELAQPTTNFFTSDGTAPLVTPFFVPQHIKNPSDGQYSRVQSTEDDSHTSTHQSQNSHNYQSSGYGPSASPSYPVSTSSPTYSHHHSTPSPLLYPGESTTTSLPLSHGTYSSYESPATGNGGVQAGESIELRNGLAHPDDFEYRDPSY